MIKDGSIVAPMLYAIMAHEMWHELHKTSVHSGLTFPPRKLEVDRFAGILWSASI